MKAVISVSSLFITLLMLGAPALAAYEDLSLEDKARALENYQRYQDMSGNEKAQLKADWEHYQSLSPELKEKIGQRYSLFKQTNPEHQKWLKRRARPRRTAGKTPRSSPRRSLANENGQVRRNQRRRRLRFI